MTITEDFESLERFWKTRHFFRTLEYRFLLEIIMIENATFPYKTALSKTNVKTNRIERTKMTLQKNRVFPRPTLFF